MDKQHQEAHLNLINKLLNCTSDEEINPILAANQNLIDSELIQMMEYVAEVFKEKGDSNRANFFINLARQL
ncbi:hypothetical protein [Okeania sp. KiyG1]|uniref:hypothetical protein n=1 Tax=Okeania sp. KiyG1 TaxID=2720165 RepID=UPI001920807B|nr:hypothetical protein [Okeania sp. KiyG1]GGA52820.1 hypothetical protein CYANOKiyG1_72750 [Okeania sp. KiyG1]